jgi:non-specific protein-tyrosine kinase
MRILDELQNDSPMATEVRKLESWLWHIVQQRRMRKVLVTSALRGEGKSTTVAYLATALASHQGRRIIAIDLDFRRPSLARHLEVEPAVGIEFVLSGEKPLSAALTKTAVPNLQIMAPRVPSADPSLLETSFVISDVLQALESYGDVILLDTPALIPVADASALLPLADGVILVAMAGLSTKHHLGRAREMCVAMGANLLGLVVGNVQEAAPEYLDSHYYHDYARRNGAGRHQG